MVRISCCALVLLTFAPACAQVFTQEDMIVHSDTDRFFWKLFREKPPQKLLDRKKELRALQGKGYARTLTELKAGDELMALIAFIKTNLTVDYSISHVAVAVDIATPSPRDSIDAVVNPYEALLPVLPRKPEMMEFNLDYRFPGDPWRKE
jgi:hypothetical protein